MFAREAAIADLWGEQPAELGRALSRLQLIWPVAAVATPLIAGQLAARSVQLPCPIETPNFLRHKFLCDFAVRLIVLLIGASATDAVAALLYGSAGLLLAPRVRETLPPHKRRSVRNGCPERCTLSHQPPTQHC